HVRRNAPHLAEPAVVREDLAVRRDDEDAVDRRLALRLEKRLLETQLLLGALALRDVARIDDDAGGCGVGQERAAVALDDAPAAVLVAVAQLDRVRLARRLEHGAERLERALD